jgi:hypothetical protein
LNEEVNVTKHKKVKIKIFWNTLDGAWTHISDEDGIVSLMHNMFRTYEYLITYL